MSAYSDLLQEIAREFPDFKVVPKSESRLMRAIDVALKLITLWRMRTFMTRFTTTVGMTVYVSPEWEQRSEKSRMVILRHERGHMRQARRYTRPVFSLLYLVVLPAVWTFRAKFEAEAYEESMRAAAELFGPGALDDEHRRWTVRHFTSAEYFWMRPFRRSVERWYDGARDRILAGQE